MTARTLLVAALALSLAAGCDDAPSAPPDAAADVPLPSDLGGAEDVPVISLDGLRSLSISPSTVTLDGGPTTVATARFTATGTFDDGSSRDVTSALQWELSPGRLGRVERGEFRSGSISGGEGQITARPSRTSPISAFATVRVRWLANNVPDSLPADIASRFASATAGAAGAATIVYPYDEVTLPPNLSGIEVHWRGDTAATAYELRFSSPLAEVRLYRGCAAVGGGCVEALDRTALRQVADTHRGATDDVSLTVRTLHRDGRVSTSPAVRLRFTPDDVQGALYYWTAARPANGVYRYDFSNGDRAPQPFITQADSPRDHNGTQHACVGCHALSNDGRQLAAVLGGGDVADLVLLDVSRRATTAQRIQRWAQLATFSPGGDRLLSVLDGRFSLLAASDLSRTRAVDVGGVGSHPEWSRTDNGVVFARFNDQRESIFTRRGAIAWLPRSGDAFGAAQVLVPAVRGENRYYPGLTPDGRWAVFNRSVCPDGREPPDGVPMQGNTPGAHPCDAYDDPSAELWMVDTQLPTHTPLALATANRRGPTDTSDALTNSWPKVSPFSSLSLGRRVYWVTFSSRRGYGLRLAQNTRPQLWMVAVSVPETEDPQPLRADPSARPFWLPFQDLETGNHIAQWTSTAVAPQ